MAAGTGGAAVESAGEFAALGEGVASAGAGAVLAGVVSVAGFVAGLPTAGPGADCAESVAGCPVAGVAGALALLGDGAVVELASVASEGWAADGLFAPGLNHPNP